MKTTVHQTFPPPPQAASIPASSSHLASAYSTPSGSSAFNNSSGGKIKKLQRRRTGTYDYWANGRAFSGFKNLCSLSLIGISNLDCLGEIAACLKASSISLRSLTLSLSNELALRARKPSTTNPTVDETSDTDPDPEDEEEIIEASTPNLNSAGQPVNEADIRKEKLAQEAILARIFDLQGVAAEGKRLERSIVRPVPIAGPKYVEGDSQSFAHDLKSMLKTLFNIISGDFEKENYRREALLSMQKVAEKYLSTLPKKTKKPVKDSSKQKNPGSSKISLTPKLPDPTLQEFGHVGAGKSSGGWEASSSSSLPNDWSFHPLNDSWASNSSGMGENSNTGSGKQGTIYPESYMSPYDAGYPITAPKGLPPAHPYSNPGPSIGFWGIPKAPQKSQPKTKLGQAVFDDTELLKSLNQESEAVKLGKLKSAQDKLDFDSENESDSIKKDSAPDKSPLFPAAELTPEDQEDSMDIDMEHPDENTLEAGPDQEIIAEVDDKEAAPRKRARFAEAEPISSTSLGSSSAVDKPPTTESRESLLSDGEPLEGKNPDEDMRDYIRATHGLPLEEIALCLIPLKASILARALDLNVLRRLTLLSVGPQEPFWLLLSRLQSYPTHIAFESIHTDHVSIAFLEFLKKFEGLEELFMLDRNNKNDPDAGALKADINITSIRQMALHKHIKTLKRLMIKNENDESWDMDAKTIRFLSIRGASLLELAISLNMKNYVSVVGVCDYPVNSNNDSIS